MEILAPRRALAAAGAALLLAGCGAAGSSAPKTVRAQGSTLTIYLSAPGHVASAPALADVLDAERLAFAQQAPRAEHHFHLRLRELTEAKPSDDARAAIQDSSAIAYLGELLPGASADSAGITNAEDLLQVSPTDTALELTESTPAIPGAPQRYYESLSTYGRTFARVVPSDRAEARADAAELERLGVRSVYITGDSSEYSRAFSYALRHDLPSSIRASATLRGADAVFYTGVSARGALAAFAAAARTDPSAYLLGSSPLALLAGAGGAGGSGGAGAPAGPLAGIGAVARRIYISQPGFLPSALNAPARAFVRAFRARYGHTPAAEAVFGYEAMSAVLDAIAAAGAKADDRSTVVGDFFSLRVRNSPLGTFSIRPTGDITIAPFVIDRVRGGRLAPSAALQG